MSNKRYHINKEGLVFECSAEVGKCPFGERNHFSSKREAELVSQMRMERQYVLNERVDIRRLSVVDVGDMLFNSLYGRSFIEQEFSSLFEKREEDELRKMYDLIYSELFGAAIRDVSDYNGGTPDNHRVALLTSYDRILTYSGGDADDLIDYAKYKMVDNYYQNHLDNKDLVLSSLLEEIQGEWEDGDFVFWTETRNAANIDTDFEAFLKNVLDRNAINERGEGRYRKALHIIEKNNEQSGRT